MAKITQNTVIVDHVIGLQIDPDKLILADFCALDAKLRKDPETVCKKNSFYAGGILEYCQEVLKRFWYFHEIGFVLFETFINTQG